MLMLVFIIVVVLISSIVIIIFFIESVVMYLLQVNHGSPLLMMTYAIWLWLIYIYYHGVGGTPLSDWF